MKVVGKSLNVKILNVVIMEPVILEMVFVHVIHLMLEKIVKRVPHFLENKTKQKINTLFFKIELHCINQPCLNGGTCNELLDSNTFLCDCLPHYAGSICQYGYSLYFFIFFSFLFFIFQKKKIKIK